MKGASSSLSDGNVRKWNFWVIVKPCGSFLVGAGFEAFLMNGPASMPAVEIETLSTVFIWPELLRNQPALPAAFAFNVKSSPNGVFAVNESNFSLMFASSSPDCPAPDELNVWVKCAS